MDGAAGVLCAHAKVELASPPVDVKTLHVKIGKLTLTNDFLSGALSKSLSKGRSSRRKTLIDRGHGLSIAKQAKVLGISRGSEYYLRRSVSPVDLDVPIAGSRLLRDLLRQEKIVIGHRHVATLMKRMRIEAL